MAWQNPRNPRDITGSRFRQLKMQQEAVEADHNRKLMEAAQRANAIRAERDTDTVRCFCYLCALDNGQAGPQTELCRQRQEESRPFYDYLAWAGLTYPDWTRVPEGRDWLAAGRPDVVIIEYPDGFQRAEWAGRYPAPPAPEPPQGLRVVEDEDQDHAAGLDYAGTAATR